MAQNSALFLAVIHCFQSQFIVINEKHRSNVYESKMRREENFHLPTMKCKLSNEVHHKFPSSRGIIKAIKLKERHKEFVQCTHKL